MPIFIKKFKTVSISSLNKTTNRHAPSKKGPYGITLSFLRSNKTNENGNARKLEINIDTKLIQVPTAHPIKNINFISPPPKDSFLNKKFPSSISAYIDIKAIKPNSKNKQASPKP